MEAAKHENPLEELYRRRNEMPSQIWESSYNDKFVIGLEEATSYIKGLEAPTKTYIFGLEASNVGVQYGCVVSFEQKFRRPSARNVTLRTEQDEASKPKEKRSYNVQKCFAWLIHWFDFGNECKYLATFEECIALDKIYGIMRAADGSAYYAMDPARMQNASATNTICTVEVLMRVCWMDAHCTLFDRSKAGTTLLGTLISPG